MCIYSEFCSVCCEPLILKGETIQIHPIPPKTTKPTRKTAQYESKPTRTHPNSPEPTENHTKPNPNPNYVTQINLRARLPPSLASWLTSFALVKLSSPSATQASLGT